MMIWVCPKCHYKNEIEDDKLDDYWCENCGRTMEKVTRVEWEIKPTTFMPPDPRHIC